MKRVVSLLVVMVALLGCLTGCHKKKEVRGGEMPEIPDLKVICGDESVDALRGSVVWRYEDDEIRDTKPEFWQRQDETPCLKLSDTKKVNLQFDMEPLEVFVQCWSVEYWGTLADEVIDVEVRGTTFELLDGEYVYEVSARWQGNDEEGGTLSGFVYYSFCTEK